MTYTLTVSNAGPSVATGISVADTLPSSLTFVSASAGCTNVTATVTCTAATLAPSGSATFTITAKIDPTAAAGSIANTATVSAATGDPTPANNTATATIAVVQSADLTITKTATAAVAVGDPITYTITVVNTGPSNSAGHTVVDTLPPDVTYVSASAGCTESSGIVTCVGGPLVPTANAQYLITVTADTVGTQVNVATVTSPTPDPTTPNTASASTAVSAGTLFSDVAAGDPDWQNQIDGVDVMFQKSGTSTYTLKATNPGTFKYRLSLENETGIDIHVKGKQLPPIIKRGVSIKDANGGSTTVFLTVPSMPTNVGSPNPLTAAQIAEPAFQLTGWHPVQAHPDDRSDEMDITVKYIPLAAGTITDCSAAGVQGLYQTLPSNSDNLVARCLRVEGLAIPKAHEAHVHVAYEFRWKNSANWGSASQDPTQLFRAGFNFRSTTVIELDSPPSDLQARFAQQLNRLPAAVRPDYQARSTALWNKTYTGVHALGLTFAGEKMTAVGGFVFDPSGAGRPNITVRVFSAPPSADRCGTVCLRHEQLRRVVHDGLRRLLLHLAEERRQHGPRRAARTTWPAGTSTTSRSATSRARRGAARRCRSASSTGRLGRCTSTLGNKEFDEEDFFVSGPTSLTYRSQPTSGRTNKVLGTVKVALLDGFGNVMTMDSGGGASRSRWASPPVPARCSSATGLTRSLSQGTATWTDLKISTPAGVYKLKANSSVGGVPDEPSLPINVTN